MLNRFESLHNHTAISDGKQSHKEVLVTAEKCGFGFVSFTDHDILPDASTVKQLSQYNSLVEWDIGIEISSGLPAESSANVTALFHILGLRIDQTNNDLREYCNLAKEARYERLVRTVNNLKTSGFVIDIDECVRRAGEGTVGSPHISRMLLKDDSNLKRLEVLAEDMRIKSVADPELEKRYQTMMKKVNSGQRHPYMRDLLFADDAYLPDIYVPYLFALDMDSTVRLIRRAGGIAIIAHWPSVREAIPEDHLESIVSQDRVDGLELRSVFNADPDQIKQDIEFLKRLALKYKKHTTVGVDGHNEDDFYKFAQIPGALAMTIGQSEQFNQP